MLTMKLSIEYSAYFLDAGRQFTGKNTPLLLQTSGIQVKGVNEMWGLRHISPSVKSEMVNWVFATSAADGLIPSGPIEGAQVAVHFSIRRCQEAASQWQR